ncbi:hypothetical protein ES708_19260 [subsurface metagenome]
MPSDNKETGVETEEEKRQAALRKKYPNADTDSFQHYCLQWEMFSGGKGSWVVIGSGHDIEQLVESFSETVDIAVCVEAGLVIQAISEQPDGPPTGFQALCYEKDKDLIKSKLLSLGIKESELSWTPESEHRKSFEEWKANYKEE